jgi:hypothetical protein
MGLQVLQLLVDRNIGLVGVIDGMDMGRYWVHVYDACATATLEVARRWRVEGRDRRSLVDGPLLWRAMRVGEEVNEEVQESRDDPVVLDEVGCDRGNSE